MKKAIIILILLLVLGAEIFLLAKFGRGKWNDKLGLALSVIGFYGISIGFIKKSAIGKTFSNLLEEMTSPNPILFMAGNFSFMGLFLNLVSLGFDKKRNPQSSLPLGCAGMFLLLLLFPFVLGYTIFHLLIIMPLAYLAYLISSAIIETICGAAGDIEMAQSAPGEADKKLSLKSIISSDREASKSFLIGVPSIVIAFLLKSISMFG